VHFTCCLGLSSRLDRCVLLRDTRELELVYQNSEDGNSLAMLYSCVGSYAPLIILLEDSNRHLFGCFLATPLKCQKTLSTFGGTGEVLPSLRV
jgi:hypothetical protein